MKKLKYQFYEVYKLFLKVVCNCTVGVPKVTCALKFPLMKSSYWLILVLGVMTLLLQSFRRLDSWFLSYIVSEQIVADWSARCEEFWNPTAKHTRPWAWEVHAMVLLFLPFWEYSTRTSILYTQFQKHSGPYIFFQISFMHRNNNYYIKLGDWYYKMLPLDLWSIEFIIRIEAFVFLQIIWETKVRNSL